MDRLRGQTVTQITPLHYGEIVSIQVRQFAGRNAPLNRCIADNSQYVVGEDQLQVIDAIAKTKRCFVALDGSDSLLNVAFITAELFETVQRATWML